jgi:hypothetical protein
MAGNGTLSQNQKKVIAALLTEATIRDAAKKAGLGERTVHRYLADEAFKAELRRQQDRTIAAATAALSGLAGTAIATLKAVLEDASASHATKVRAALGVLEQRRKAAELDSLTARVEALERARYK